jgi:hypothetical protein
MSSIVPYKNVFINSPTPTGDAGLGLDNSLINLADAVEALVDAQGVLDAPQLDSPPSSPNPGQIYFDINTNTLQMWNGSAWVKFAVLSDENTFTGVFNTFDAIKTVQISSDSNIEIAPNGILQIDSNVDFRQNQGIGFVVENEFTPPGGPVTGQLYYDQNNNQVMYWNGSAWIGSGQSGYSGSSGRSGLSGYSGLSGRSGYSGASTSGFSGYSGGSGFSGYSGISGASVSGVSGYSGTSGRSGYSGSGLSGFSGYSGAAFTSSTFSLSVSLSAVTPVATSSINTVSTDAGSLTSNTLTINSPGGSPNNGDKFILRIKNTNAGSTAMTISFNAIFNKGGLTVNTVAVGKTDFFGFIYDSTASKWDVLAYQQGY